MISVVIEDGAFATGLGVFLTSTLALMAYMVKTLFSINASLAVLTQRVDGLERRETIRWGSAGAIRIRLLAGVGAIALLLCVLWGGLYLWTESNQQRRYDACVNRQNLYDGQITYTRFLADQFRATPEQTEAGLRALRKATGPRPEC